MKERPILFSAPMVRALLSGAKTQTRRTVKLPHANPLGEWQATTFGGADARGAEHPEQAAIWHTRTGETRCCPYGLPGERLWVRETWAYYGGDEYLYQRNTGAVLHRADDLIVEGLDAIPGGRWRPSIHMPRWACRLVLEITDVRVERLQAISEADALAEGIQPEGPDECAIAFQRLWESINGADSWAANPWVWALTIRRLP